MRYFFGLLLCCCFLLSFSLQAGTEKLQLKENLKQATPGDYLVTAQGKNYTVLLIRSKQAETISIEEITVPSARVHGSPFAWRKWIEGGAKGHISRLLYHINLQLGTVQQTFSYARNEWVSLPQSQNFLTTLLNLNFELIPENERKKVGPPPASDSRDRRALWQPSLVVEGNTLTSVPFNGWKATWPKDGGEISGKLIEVFLPKDSSKYPAYFPYWLQVSGMVGKAKVRIVDSGSHLKL